MKKLMLLIGQAEPQDTLNTMRGLGLEFEIVSSETDFDNASSEIEIETADANAFVQKVGDQADELEMLWQLSILKRTSMFLNNKLVKL